MPIVKDYMRYVHGGQCGCVGSHAGAICAVDQSTCAVTANELVNFYNMKTTEKVFEIDESTKSVTCLKFSNDKRRMAIGYADGAIRVFDRTNQDQSSVVFSGHKTGVNCLAFSEDGLTLASGGKDCSIIVWDVVSESGLFRVQGHKESVTHLQFVRGNQFLISASKDTTVKFWSIASHSCFYTLLDNRSEVYSLSLLNEDSLLICASAELELLVVEIVWINGEIENIENDEPKAKKTAQSEAEVEFGDMQNRYVRVSVKGKLLRQCKGRALQLVLSPDQRTLICLGSDRLMDVYRVFTEQEAAKRLTKKLKAAKRKAAGAEGDSIAILSEADVKKDVTILVTRIGDHRMQQKPKWIDFAPAYKTGDNDEVVSYTGYCLMSDNTVHTLKLSVDLSNNSVSTETLNNLDQLGHRSDVRSLSVSASGSAIVSGGGDELIVWNTHSLRPGASLRDDGMKDVTAVLFATGDGHVVAGAKNGELFVWELGSCELLESRKAHEGTIWGLVALPGKQGFVTASADKTIKFWSYELISEGTRKRLTIREKRVLHVNDEALGCALSPDGKFLVVGLLDNTAVVYFVDSLKFYLSLYGHSLPVTCVTVSQDSKLVVTGSADKSIKIWGLDFGDCHKSFHAHDDIVSAVLFSPSDENLVWSAGKDGKVKQWDAVKLNVVQTLDRHTAEVRALAQNESGSLLFSCSHDKSIRCWELTEEIIVLEEEEEMQREEDYENRLLDDEDVVAGEDRDAEVGLAARKTHQSLVSTEQIIDAVDIVRNDRLLSKDDPQYKPHPLIAAYASKTLDHFILDTVARIRPSHLERSLLMLPLSYVADILASLSECVKMHYKVELATRISLFLISDEVLMNILRSSNRDMLSIDNKQKEYNWEKVGEPTSVIHHSHVVNSLEMLPVVDKLRSDLPQGIQEVRDIVGLNLAALQLLKVELEDSQQVKLFADIGEVESGEKKKKKKKERKAVIRTIA